jgi:hypothetical protein
LSDPFNHVTKQTAVDGEAEIEDVSAAEEARSAEVATEESAATTNAMGEE